MKKIVRILLVASLALFALSCTQEPVFSPAPVSDASGLQRVDMDVTFEDSKAMLGDDRSVVWEVGDEVAVYDRTGFPPRKFTVTAVSSSGAVISGDILEGCQEVWAVRPYSAADYCLLNNELRVRLPETQVIPDGGSVDPSALVSVARATAGDALHFHNAVSLLKFEITSSGVTSVVIAGTRREELGGVSTVSADGGARVKSNSAAELVVSPSSGTFAPGTYYATVFPASLAHGFGAHCYDGDMPVCSKITGVATQFARNGSYNLGIVSSLDGVAPRVYEEGSIADVDSFLSSTGYSIPSIYMSLLKLVYLKNPGNKLYTYKFTYPSVDPAGNPTTLSAVMYVPQTAVENHQQVTGMTLVSHGTVTSAPEAPTRAAANLEGLVAWRTAGGFAVVIADNYGLGVSERFPQSYLDADAVGRSNLDALAAARTILSGKGVSVGSKLYNFGYSQGGYSAMATLRYVSMHPELGIDITHTISGAGPHDINLFYDTVKNDSYPRAAGFFPLAIVSANENGHLGLQYENIFKEPLLSHIDDWVLSKEYNSNRIASLLGTDKLSGIVLPSIVGQTGPEAAALMSYYASNDLTSGWVPAQGSRIFLYHSTQDDTVPCACSDDLNAFLKGFETSRGLTLEYTSTAAGTHTDAVIPFALAGISYFK